MVLLPESLSSFFILYKSCQSGSRWFPPTDFHAGTGSMRPDLPPYGGKVSQTPNMGFAVGASKARVYTRARFPSIFASQK